MVRDGAAQMGIELSRTQVELFSEHAVLLLEWNRKINLTAIVEPAEMAVKHYLDAIAPLAHIPADGYLMDIGTGGGFPGIPLKIVRPDQPMTLIDSVRKKISFVKQAIRQLGLKSIQAHQTRVEALADQTSEQGKYKAIVCRAWTDLQEVVSLAQPLLAPSGSIVAYQGPEKGDPKADIDPNAMSGLRIETFSYRLPISGDPRSVTVLQDKKQ